MTEYPTKGDTVRCEIESYDGSVEVQEEEVVEVDGDVVYFEKEVKDNHVVSSRYVTMGAFEMDLWEVVE